MEYFYPIYLIQDALVNQCLVSNRELRLFYYSKPVFFFITVTLTFQLQVNLIYRTASFPLPHIKAAGSNLCRGGSVFDGGESFRGQCTWISVLLHQTVTAITNIRERR